MSFESLIGKRIKEFREKNGWRQEELAEKTGLSTKYISCIERGTKAPKLKTFVLLINALKVTSDDILQDVLDVEYTLKIENLNKKISSIDLEEQKKLLRMLEYLSDK